MTGMHHRIACLRLFALLALATPAAEAQAPAEGMLLVATPTLADPNFAASVVLLVYHDSNGSLGIFLNRPTNLRPSRVFPDLEAVQDLTDTVFFGGPLEPSQVLLLLRDPPAGAVDSNPVVDDVYITADATVLESYESNVDSERVRLYAGHAAWGPGQLQDEIDRGDWNLALGHADLVFTAEPLELWRRTATQSAGLVASRGNPSLGFSPQPEHAVGASGPR
jgi:putative transcriptional regulator